MDSCLGIHRGPLPGYEVALVGYEVKCRVAEANERRDLTGASNE